MVCFGRLYVTVNGGRDCNFTEDQKRTFMVQRALAASPLMLYSTPPSIITTAPSQISSTIGLK